ncbi:hypothetical protein Btru_009656 [Bulinus truncatus]|nr:hypothetical protein Btru_009656 [Bulinus truncatus]
MELNHKHLEKTLQMNDLEIIDFFKPLEDNKNLFIRNITLNNHKTDPEQIIMHRLHKVFSKFGLLYEVQVLPCSFQKIATESVSEENISVKDSLNFYAFVKFYSSTSAENAKNALHLTHFVGATACRINYAKRKRTESEKKELFIAHCCDLANYYLGFNGWSSSINEIKKLISTTTSMSSKEDHCSFLCVTNLIIHNHGLNITEKGISELKFSSEDPLSRINAHKRCMKQAHHAALQKAFSKVILVVLSNGKVYADINSSVREDFEEFKPLHTNVPVNELEEEPELSSDGGEIDSFDEDIINILKALDTDVAFE